eukprot:TRINITY_DN4760_c0_g1_i1.p1 TRINITY_DN4760_c0_g1~~TRINITY_DN4760_c0_g1_i1.p1  ORF type:complete len:784 (-),score=71.09 TRINITY_DN4760_c0_g1_i1:55-2406(-)
MTRGWIISFGLFLYANCASVLDCSTNAVLDAFSNGGDYISNCGSLFQANLPGDVFASNNLTIDGNGQLSIASSSATIFFAGVNTTMTLKNLELHEVSISQAGVNTLIVLEGCKLQEQHNLQFAIRISPNSRLVLNNSVVFRVSTSTAVLNTGLFECIGSTITSFPLQPVPSGFGVATTDTAITKFAYCTVTGFEKVLQGPSTFNIDASIIFGNITEDTMLLPLYSLFTSTHGEAPLFKSQYGVNSSSVLGVFNSSTGFELLRCSPAINVVGDIQVILPGRNLQGAPDAGAVESNFLPCGKADVIVSQYPGSTLRATATISSPSILPILVTHIIKAGTAVNGLDYNVVSTTGVYEITPENPVASVEIPLLEHSSAGNNKTFYVEWGADGLEQESLNATTTCLILRVAPPCPIVQCPDQTCANSPSLCPQQPSQECFVCSNGICQPTPRLCEQNCITPSCWDGNCATPKRPCPAVPACPSLKKRCNDGTCKDTCSELSICTSDYVPCPDGTCASRLDLCSPFNGCPVGYVKCFDGSCVTDVASCRCEGGYFKCFDGTCQQQCAKSPVVLQPLEVSYFFSVNGEVTLEILGSDDERSFLGSISAEVELDGNNILQVGVAGVPDSVLRYSTLPESSKIVSSAIRLTSDSSAANFLVGNVAIALAIDNYFADQSVDSFCIAALSKGSWNCVSGEDLSINQVEGQTVVKGSAARGSDYSVLFTDNSFDSSQGSSGEGSNRTVIIASVVVVCIAVAVVGAFFAYITWRKKREQRTEDMALQTRLNSSSSF